VQPFAKVQSISTLSLFMAHPGNGNGIYKFGAKDVIALHIKGRYSLKRLHEIKKTLAGSET